MTDGLRILVATAPVQPLVFRIEPTHVSDALARCPLDLPSIETDFCSIEDPAFGERAQAAFAIIGFRIPTRLIAKSRGALRLIQVTGAGVEHLLPFDWVPRNVAIATASGVHAAKLREWATMVFLMLHSRMPHFVTAQRAHQWSKFYSTAIAGHRALIFGTGAVGRAIAQAAKRLGLTTVGVRRNPAPARGFDSVIGMAGAPEAASQADFVVLATPLTPATRGLMNAAMFERMREGASFANFGRGGLVDQAALIEALTSGRLGGAVIDVTEPEPPPADSPLWDAPRLVITPHISCDDPFTYVPQTLDLFLHNLHRRLGGRSIRNRVNLARAY